MRKRSGALHSDSEEGFLLLAELSHQKTGYFYDETLHAQLSKQLQPSKSTSPARKQSSTYMEGFDYASPNREQQEQLKELQAQNKANLVNLTLVCNSLVDIHPTLARLCPNHSNQEIPSPERRGIDLHIINSQDFNGRSHCLKIWTIEAQLVSNPLYGSYLKRAVKVFDFSGGSAGEQHGLEEAQQILRVAVRALTH